MTEKPKPVWMTEKPVFDDPEMEAARLERMAQHDREVEARRAHLVGLACNRCGATHQVNLSHGTAWCFECYYAEHPRGESWDTPIQKKNTVPYTGEQRARHYWRDRWASGVTITIEDPVQIARLVALFRPELQLRKPDTPVPPRSSG